MEDLAELVTAVLASRRASPADDSFMSNADALGAEHERDVIAKVTCTTTTTTTTTTIT